MPYTEKWIDEDALLDYLSEMGAATIKEIKTAFNTDSKSTRLSLFSLGLSLEDEDRDEEYTLLVTGGRGLTTYWYLWPKHKRGKPNPGALRNAAEARRRSRLARRADEARQRSMKPTTRRRVRMASGELVEE